MSQMTVYPNPGFVTGSWGPLVPSIECRGIAVVWFTSNPKRVSQATSGLAPAVYGICIGNLCPRMIRTIRSYMRTQAMSITSPAVLERVVDDLARRKMAIFSKAKGGARWTP